MVDLRGIKTEPTIQIEPDKWYRVNSPEVTECCECSLVHITEYMLSNGTLFFRTKVNRRATTTKRKRYGITITRKPT